MLTAPRETRPAGVRVVVVGAGYAGLIATNRFLGSLTADERRAVRVTVVNPRDTFVERIRLHQLAAGSLQTVTRPLSAVLHPEAEVLLGTAERIDAQKRVVAVATEGGHRELTYDHLVYAVGSTAAAPIPGARQHAFLLADHEGAERAADALRAVGPQPRVLVVGGGLTGVEAAAEIAEQHPSALVTLLCSGELLPSMRAAARSGIARRLRRLDVLVTDHTDVEAIHDGYALTGDGGRTPFDVCLVAASFEVPQLARASGLAVDVGGRLLVDETLRTRDVGILGAGDAVHVTGPVGEHLRMACSVAVPMGGHAAGVLVAALRDVAPEPFDMGFSAQCVSLGRRHGYIQLVHPDDTPRALHIGGRLGARIKEAVCRRVVEAPAAEAMSPGTYTWRPGPRKATTAHAPRPSATADPAPAASTAQH